jgi:hypothetical protein
MVTTTLEAAEVVVVVMTKLNGKVVQVAEELVLGHTQAEVHRVKLEDKPLPVQRVVEAVAVAQVQDIYKEEWQVVLVL